MSSIKSDRQEFVIGALSIEKGGSKDNGLCIYPWLFDDNVKRSVYTSSSEYLSKQSWPNLNTISVF